MRFQKKHVPTGKCDGASILYTEGVDREGHLSSSWQLDRNFLRGLVSLQEAGSTISHEELRLHLEKVERTYQLARRVPSSVREGTLRRPPKARDRLRLSRQTAAISEDIMEEFI